MDSIVYLATAEVDSKFGMMVDVKFLFLFRMRGEYLATLVTLANTYSVLVYEEGYNIPLIKTVTYFAAEWIVYLRREEFLDGDGIEVRAR